MAEKTVTIPAVLPLAEARQMVEEIARSGAWAKLDEIDCALETNPNSFRVLPTDHLFLPGMYVRTVFMAAGRYVSTRIHLTEHPFIISAGRALVWTEGEGVVELGAHYIGTTKPGTRRLLYILEDCMWTTVHLNPDNETDPDKIVERLTYNNRELREKLP